MPFGPDADFQMTTDRNLVWEGCHNTRDLGGLESRNGDVIRRGTFVRSDSPHNLTEAGWQSLRGYGIKTIIDLRNESERVETISTGNQT
ncbi:MAG TPA: tyrosine-protein phosphatase, partial [Pseudobdellovibrionaceae bacterium]|nr:tyrosine-protein phosphatase [Pseudobdellovibrionaceae bacterium]